MAKLNEGIANRIRMYAGSRRSREVITAFLESALECEPNFEASLGHENWKAIDMWISGHRVGLVFPKKELIKFFNRLPHEPKTGYALGRLNNRGEWEFEASKLPSIEVMLRCLRDNIKTLSVSKFKSNRNISSRVRFEVFVRDKYTCQYCGRKGPDVQLHVDHKHPVSLGGSNVLENLITACSECNLGKSNRHIT